MKKFYKILIMVLSAVMLSAVTVFAGTEQCVRRYDSSQLSLSAVDASDGNRYTAVSWEGLQSTAEVGAPELPVEYIRFIVPVYTNNFTATVKMRKVTTPQKIENQVMPVQQPVSTSYTGQTDFTAPDSTLYSVDYNIRAEVVEDGFIDGCNHIVTVAVYPLQYSATAGTYSTASMLTVELTYDDCNLAEMNHTPIFPPHMSKYLDLPSMVVNPDRVTNPRFVPKKKAEGLTKDYYYIITPRNLKKAFEDLAVWKRQKGYNVIVKCIEDIYEDDRYRIGNSHSLADSVPEQILDSAMSLRCYLKDQFQLNGQYFCLLAGDWRTPMPIRYVNFEPDSKITNSHVYYSDYCTHKYSENFIPTDSYFIDLTSKWKLNTMWNPSVYAIYHCDATYSPSIPVGRLLCSSEREVHNYIDKLILYETNPGYGDNDYLSRFTMFAECNYNYYKVDSKYHHLDCLIDNARSVYSDVLKRLQKNFIEDDTHQRYNKETLDYQPHGNYPSADYVLSEIKESGISSWHGHGSPYGIATSYATHVIHPVSSMSGKDPYADYPENPQSGVNTLNNENKPIVVYSISCDNAPFDYYEYMNKEGTWTMSYPDVNLGRAMTTEGKYGSVGFCANSRYGWIGPAERYEKAFFSYLDTVPNIGIAFIKGKLNAGPKAADLFANNLIGEPEFEIWLDKPQSLPASLSPNTAGFEIEGAMPDSTMVSFFNGDYLAVKSYNIDSTMTNPFGSGDYCVSFWKTDYLPVITLFAQNGLLNSQKRYIVRDAIIGSKDGSDTKYIVGKGGKLTVRAIDSAETLSGFEVEDGGVVELNCDQTVSLSGGIVRKGGKLIVNGKNVKFGKGFKVMPGGVLKINNK